MNLNHSIIKSSQFIDTFELIEELNNLVDKDMERQLKAAQLS